MLWTDTFFTRFAPFVFLVFSFVFGGVEFDWGEEVERESSNFDILLYSFERYYSGIDAGKDLCDEFIIGCGL